MPPRGRGNAPAGRGRGRDGPPARGLVRGGGRGGSRGGGAAGGGGSSGSVSGPSSTALSVQTVGDDGDRNQSPFRSNDGGGGGGDDGGDRNPPPSPVQGGGGGGVSDSDGDRNPSNTVARAQTVVMRRPGHGQSGKKIKVATNHFVVTIPESIIHHYDGMGLTLDRH